MFSGHSQLFDPLDHFLLEVSSRFGHCRSSQRCSLRLLTLRRERCTCFVEFVIVDSINWNFPLILAIFHPVWSKNAASSLSKAAHAAFFFIWEDLPSFIIDCHRNTGSVNVGEDRSAEEVVPSIIPIDSFPFVQGVVVKFSCG